MYNTNYFRLRILPRYFWTDTLVGRVVGGILLGLTLSVMVLFLSGAQNVLLWNHLLPVGWNEAGTLLIALCAFGYGMRYGWRGQRP
jgi:hypothetical protein